MKYFSLLIPILGSISAALQTMPYSVAGYAVGYILIASLDEFLKMILIGVTISTLSALLEEVAWRGFLRNELNVVSKVKAYFVTALIWSTWHIPIAVLYRYTDDIFVNTTLYCGQLFLFSLIMNWIRDKSNSVIPASLFHGMLNVFYF